MSTGVRHHVKAANELSKELTERTTEIREMDIKMEGLLSEMEANVRELLKTRFMATTRRPNKRQKTNMTNLQEKIKQDEQTCTELSNEKTSKAAEMYDKVDKLIKKVDRSLKQLETDIEKESQKLGLLNAQKTEWMLTPPRPLTRKGGPKAGARPGSSSRGRGGRLKRKNGQSLPGLMPPFQEQAVLPLTGGAEMGFLDSSEPRYCRCNQVSYGEMVGCDDPDCPIEWFHFECVGLKEKPKGKWYCPECTERRNAARVKR